MRLGAAFYDTTECDIPQLILVKTGDELSHHEPDAAQVYRAMQKKAEIGERMTDGEGNSFAPSAPPKIDTRRTGQSARCGGSPRGTACNPRSAPTSKNLAGGFRDFS